MDSVQGKTAVVTGAGSGMGRAFAERFARAGMNVVLADVEVPALDAAVAAITATGAQAIGVPTDVSDGASVDRLRDAALDAFGRVNVLCNNAGVGGSMGGGEWVREADWRWVLDVNLWGVIHGHRAFLPHLVGHGDGHIVNTASMAGLVALPGAAPYNVTKTGVVALSEGLYLELKATGSPVRVSALCPGFVKTNLAKGQKWTERLGNEPAAAQTPMAQMMDAVLAQGVEEGIEATDVADQVVDAIRTERFWILTHPEMRQAPVERMQRAADQVNPG